MTKKPRESMSRRQFLSLVGAAPLAPLLANPLFNSTNKSYASYSLQIAGVDTNAELLHTIKGSGSMSDSHWQSTWSDVRSEGQLESEPFVDVGCAAGKGANNTQEAESLHLLGVTSDGEAWHTIRFTDGSWQEFRNLQDEAGQPGSFTRVSCAQTRSDETHVLAITSDGALWHSIRFDDGSWQQFNNLQPVTGSIGNVVDVGCAIANSVLHVVALTDDGEAWHAIRFEDGSWQEFRNLQGETGRPGFFIRVDCAGGNVETFTGGLYLHVLGVTSDGVLWHSIRFDDGSWQQFKDVPSTTGSIGNVVDVGCAMEYHELCVVAVTDDGHVWNSTRKSERGRWDEFLSVNSLVSGDYRFICVSAACMPP